MNGGSQLYGLIAEFDSPEALRAALEALHQRGFRRLEAYTPFPVEGLAGLLGHKRDWLPLSTLLGGIAGAALSYFIQYYSAVINYPVNIGGRPLHSWPAFLPVSIEFTILGAVAATTLAMLIADRLPKLYHPVFSVPRFEYASRDAFFLCIRADDERFDAEQVRRLLADLGGQRVTEVAP